MKGWSVAAGIFLILLILGAVWDHHTYPWFTPSFPSAPAKDPFAPPGTRPSWLKNTPGFVYSLREKKANREEKQAFRRHIKQCLKVFREFSFSDVYFGCDNSDTGRWYLHFQDDGTIAMAVPSGSSRQYMPDSYYGPEPPTPVSLEDVFPTGVTFKRNSDLTISFHSEKGSRTFSMEPNFGVGNPEFCTNSITFQDTENPDLRFVLTSDKYWKGDFESYWEHGQRF